MLITQKHIILIVVTLICVFCSSCKKKDTNNFPEISLDSNSSSFSCIVPCYFTVSGTVKDDKGLDFVSVVLNDKSGEPIQLGQFKKLDGKKEASFSFTIELSNVYIESGVYNLRVQVSDGELKSSKNIDVAITVPPITIEKIYLFSYNGSATDVYEYTSSGNILITTLNSDIQQAYCDSKNKQIITGGAKSNISFYDDTFNIKYGVNSKNTFFPFFHHYTQDSYLDYFHFYVSDEEGFISRYLESAALNLNFRTESSGNALLPYYFSNIETGYTIVDMQDASNTKEELHTYYTSTGYLINTTPFTNKELVGVGDFSDNTPLLFLNENGVGQVVSYNLKDNLLAKLKDFTGEILDIYQISKDEYFLATSNGVVKYTYSSSSAIVVNTYVCSKFVFNKVSGTALGISDNTIIEMDNIGNTSIFTTISDNVDAISIMYSR